MLDLAPTLVVFDLDDTLYPYDQAHAAGTSALIRYGAHETRIAAEQFESTLRTARERVKDRLGPTGTSHSRLLYVSESLELLGFRFQGALALALEQEYWRNYILAAVLRPNVEEFFTLLRYNEIPIAVVTDLTSAIQYRKLVHLRLDALIDHVVVSDECAGDKVTLDPFRLLGQRCDRRQLENVWFIGDGPQDAPVAALVSEGIIDQGHGWIRGASPSEDLSTWSDIGEIESHLERLVSVRGA